MDRDLVIGIDSSTTATKAIAWDAGGRALAEGRAAIAMANPAPLRYEQDASDWWRALVAALREVTGRIDPARVAALAVVNQRETFVPVDAAGEPVGPAVLWLDERGREDVDLLVERLGCERLTRITGKIPGMLPCLYKIHWLKRHEPDLYARTDQFLEVHGFLVRRLTGVAATSWASADPMAVYDLAAKRYAPEILDVLELAPERFAAAQAPGSVLGAVTREAAAATGLPEGIKVVAGGGDGQAAGLATGTLVPGRAYLNLGTAAVSGVHGRAYATDPAFRTLTSLSGDGYIFELCLITGTFLTDWFLRSLFAEDPEADPAVYDRLEAAAAALPPGAGGLLLMPYWGGVMTPYWDADARGLILGLSSEHGRAHLYRAMMEGIALDEAMGLAGIERATGTEVTEIHAIGGGARSPLWCQIVADATGKTVTRLATAEATCLGAGMCAALGAGWFADAQAATDAMGGQIQETVEPEPAAQARYAELLAIYERLYPATRDLLHALARFKSEVKNKC